MSIHWDVDDGIQLLLPPLTIQPLVENAVKHGLLSRSKGGMLKIRIVRRHASTLFEIIDDGVGMEQTKAQLILDLPQAQGGIGLFNTNRRLKQLYGKGLSISSSPGVGTNVSFEIPDR